MLSSNKHTIRIGYSHSDTEIVVWCTCLNYRDNWTPASERLEDVIGPATAHIATHLAEESVQNSTAQSLLGVQGVQPIPDGIRAKLSSGSVVNDFLRQFGSAAEEAMGTLNPAQLFGPPSTPESPNPLWDAHAGIMEAFGLDPQGHPLPDEGQAQEPESTMSVGWTVLDRVTGKYGDGWTDIRDKSTGTVYRFPVRDGRTSFKTDMDGHISPDGAIAIDGVPQNPIQGTTPADSQKVHPDEDTEGWARNLMDRLDSEAERIRNPHSGRANDERIQLIGQRARQLIGMDWQPWEIRKVLGQEFNIAIGEGGTVPPGPSCPVCSAIPGGGHGGWCPFGPDGALQGQAYGVQDKPHFGEVFPEQARTIRDAYIEAMDKPMTRAFLHGNQGEQESRSSAPSPDEQIAASRRYIQDSYGKEQDSGSKYRRYAREGRDEVARSIRTGIAKVFRAESTRLGEQWRNAMQADAPSYQTQAKAQLSDTLSRLADEIEPWDQKSREEYDAASYYAHKDL